MALVIAGAFLLGMAVGIFTIAICIMASREDKKREGDKDGV